MDKTPTSRSAKRERLLRFASQAEFAAHRQIAQRFENKGFSALVAPANHWQLGVVVSRARLGGAVERNRAKRRLRAAFAQAQKKQPRPVLAAVLYAKAPALTLPFAQLVDPLCQAFYAMASDSDR